MLALIGSRGARVSVSLAQTTSRGGVRKRWGTLAKLSLTLIGSGGGLVNALRAPIGKWSGQRKSRGGLVNGSLALMGSRDALIRDGGAVVSLLLALIGISLGLRSRLCAKRPAQLLSPLRESHPKTRELLPPRFSALPPM